MKNKKGILLRSCSSDENKFWQRSFIYTEIFIEDDETYIISTIKNNGNRYDIKVEKILIDRKTF